MADIEEEEHIIRKDNEEEDHEMKKEDREGKELIKKDNKEGNEWEVVSLTASTYAAAPGPKEVESLGEEKGNVSENEAETSQALFMSRHFAFPPNQHENLPVRPETEATHEEVKENEDSGEMYLKQEGIYEQNEEENWNVKGLNVPEDGDRISIHGTESDEAEAPHAVDETDKEEDMYSTVAYDETNVTSDLVESSEHDIDPTFDISQSMEHEEDDENDIPKLPCGAWWKRRVASLCAIAKETNTFWSLFITAAVMGLVILGQRWQQERWQVLQERWQLSLNDKKSGRMLQPITRLKDLLVRGSRRSSYITTAASPEH